MAGALTVVGFALAPPAGAAVSVDGDRIAGINRYATAAAVAGQADFDGATTAILATGETFPDALAASGLAGANGPAPIILTQSDTYSDEAQEALNNLTTVTDVIIVGGTAAVSQGVEDAVAADGFTVTRVAGADRYATAADIAAEMGAVGQIDGLDTALIATGTGFADALAGGPVSYAGSLPILLVGTDEIPTATADAIADLGIEQAVILGGTAAVSDAVEAELDDLTGNPSVRIAGDNRFGTAAAVGEFAIAELGWGPTEVLLASGLNFPDALAAGPLGGERNAPVILTASLPDESADFLDDHSDTITDITAMGGTGVVDDETLTDATDAAETVDNDEEETTTGTSVLDSPELQSVEFVSQNTATTATYRFNFDEAVSGATAPVAASYHLVAASGGTRYNGTAAQVQTGQTSSVLVTFTITAEQRTSVTLATTDAGAATDASADASPEGDAPQSATAATAGTSDSPDLLTAGNFRADATGTGVLVDLTYDEAVFVVTPLTTAFHFVDTSGGDTVGASVTDITGQGTTTLTVFISPATTTAVSSSTIARVCHEQDRVRDSGGDTSPLECVDANGTGNTTDPDLVSATFNPDATTNAGVSVDAVSYIFDTAVNFTSTGALFFVYDVEGNETAGTAGSAVRSLTNDTMVTVNFADGTLSDAVGVWVDDAAVTAATGTAVTNEEDEVAVQGVSFTAGSTGGPDLIDARLITAATDAFSGAVTDYAVVFTFDETINAALTAANFKVYAGVTTAGAAFATGGTLSCTVTRSTTNLAEAILTGCTGAARLSPTNAGLNGNFMLAAVNDAAVTDAGAVANPEGSEAITQP